MSPRKRKCRSCKKFFSPHPAKLTEFTTRTTRITPDFSLVLSYVLAVVTGGKATIGSHFIMTTCSCSFDKINSGIKG